VRRTYELAAAEAGRGDRCAADLFIVEAWGFAASEERWRRNLTICNLDPARIDREVRRVRALAEGRLVREVRFKVRGRLGESEETSDRAEAAEACRDRVASGDRVVKVTRIRRPS